MDVLQLEVKLLSENATLPKRGSPFSAGYDLSSAHATVIPRRERAIVQTDIGKNLVLEQVV
jgi:dUTP diphosphatase